MDIIQAENYRYYYPEEEQPALTIEKLNIPKGSFSLLLGTSGSGKTTLLRQVFGNLERAGRETGMLCCESEKKGYVWQNPENQIVTDRVEYEIVFGMENLGMKKTEMSRRLAEMVTFFGMEELLSKDTMALSGGEMQTLNIASAVAMNPELLLLDEPASQLDPVGARRLYEFLHQLNEELGITILVAEQRLEDLVNDVDFIFYMENGKMIAQGTPASVYPVAKNFFPSYIRVIEDVRGEGDNLPSLKEARMRFGRQYHAKREVSDNKITDLLTENEKENISCKNLFFRYDKKEKDVLSECSLTIPKGKITCIAGGNGSGKSTLLHLLAGTQVPYRGHIKYVPRQMGYLPQQPEYLFLCETIEEELAGSPKGQKIFSFFEMSAYAGRNPHDLSGGEKERLALSLVLGKERELYLLDEPTRGLDFRAKKTLKNILLDYKKQGKTIVFVSHDMEFMAETADYVALLFRGNVETMAETKEFFRKNQFYTTSINRMAREVSSHIITEKDVQYYAEKNMD